MTPAELLTDAFGRIRDGAHEVVEGLAPQQLGHRPGPRSNSIAWVVWHLARVQDDHVADVAGLEQVWTSQGWLERFGLPFEPSDTGYGHSPDQAAKVQVESGEVLTGYLDAVHGQTLRYVESLREADLDRVVDTRWDPPVTLGTRLVSVVNDDQQHVGQAAYVRGLIGG